MFANVPVFLHHIVKHQYITIKKHTKQVLPIIFKQNDYY